MENTIYVDECENGFWVVSTDFDDFSAEFASKESAIICAQDIAEPGECILVDGDIME